MPNRIPNTPSDLGATVDRRPGCRHPADPAALEFAADNWQAAKTVTVRGMIDTNTHSEPAVTIRHQVSGADYGSVPAASVVATVVERDTLSIEPARASESAGSITFEVTPREPSAAAVNVDYSTSDGSARAGSDYTAASGTLTFPTNSSAAQRIVVAIAADTDIEEMRPSG